MPTSLHLSVSHYLTETYLIGSMKVLMGLKQKFSKRSCQWKFTGAGIRNESLISVFFSHFYLLFPIPLFLSSPFSHLSFFASEVCQVPGELQHRGSEAHLQEGMHHPPAKEAYHPCSLGSLWGTARWVSLSCWCTVLATFDWMSGIATAIMFRPTWSHMSITWSILSVWNWVREIKCMHKRGDGVYLYKQGCCASINS